MPLYKGQSLVAGEESSSGSSGGTSCDVKYYNGVVNDENLEMFNKAWKARNSKITIFYRRDSDSALLSPSLAILDSNALVSDTNWYVLSFTKTRIGKSAHDTTTKSQVELKTESAMLEISDDGQSVISFVNVSESGGDTGVYYLDTDASYSTPYVPSSSGQPASKKYVDDSCQNVANKISELPPVFYWDGKSSNDNPDNITLWQKIVNKSQECPVLVYADNESNISEQYYKSIFIIDSVEITSSTTSKFISGFIVEQGSTTTSALGAAITSKKCNMTLTLSSLNVSKVSAMSCYTYVCNFYLPTNSTVVTSYTPTYDYHPATKKYVDKNGGKITRYTQTGQAISAGGTLTLPFYYNVGTNQFDLWLNGEKLIIGSSSASDDTCHCKEVGTSGTSNQITITSDWSTVSTDVMEYQVRGVVPTS